MTNSEGQFVLTFPNPNSGVTRPRRFTSLLMAVIWGLSRGEKCYPLELDP